MLLLLFVTGAVMVVTWLTLRPEQDLEGFDADLREAVPAAMQPGSYALWLADVRPGD